MKAVNNFAMVKKNYLVFARMAAPVMHIKNDKHYKIALDMVELLLAEAKDDKKDPLNGLIDILGHAIESYERSLPENKLFYKKLAEQDQDVAVLRLLMDQHKLGVAGFPEIGDKSLISKILSGERNLTKNHIKKLAERFSIDPGLFF